MAKIAVCDRAACVRGGDLDCSGGMIVRVVGKNLLPPLFHMFSDPRELISPSRDRGV